ncbi:MAG: hypothetical protein GXO34_09060 [Deltaproteobacteria bacterium]|nr:hypothetical protein [Deltaproteobacteria bacterium]
MKRLIVVLVVLGLVGAEWLSAGRAMASVSGKNFSIIYSSDERGAISPCG